MRLWEGVTFRLHFVEMSCVTLLKMDVTLYVLKRSLKQQCVGIWYCVFYKCCDICFYAHICKWHDE